MTLSEKLQSIIQSSDFLKKIQSVKSFKKKVSDGDYRNLTDDEILILEKNRNSAESWKIITVKNGFTPENISGSRFHGECRLGIFTGTATEIQDGAFLPSGIYDSVIINSSIDSESLISQCRLISNYIISEKTVIHNTGSITADKNCSFGNGLVIPAGPETGEIPVPLFADMDVETASAIIDAGDKKESFDDYITMYRNAAALESGFIDRNSVITDTVSIRNSFIGEGAVISGALSISGSTILSSGNERTVIGNGVKIENSLIQYGCAVDSISIIWNSLLMEHSEASNQSRVSSSIIGPNSALGGGEVTSTFAGPFTVSHHQSLLIAAIWPGGRGNIGYGANVGSNHTSRLPDQELHPGEGMFFGLGCSIKFPADYRKSPYSIISTGTVTQPQRVEFPFSLITSPSFSTEKIPPYLNELTPAWTLSENIYALLRNESKYRSRNKARRNSFDFAILRPDITDMMINSRRTLKNINGVKEFYTEKDLPEAGKNYITENARINAVETYTFYIQYYALTALFTKTEEFLKEKNRTEMKLLIESEGSGYWSHAKQILQSESLSEKPLISSMELLISSLDKIYSDAFHARKKDYVRGVKTIDNYQLHHKSPETDQSLADIRRSTDAKIAKIKEVISLLR